MKMAMALDLETKSIDFAMAHDQLVFKTDLLLEIPRGNSLKTEASKYKCCLKLLRNFPSLKDGDTIGLNAQKGVC